MICGDFAYAIEANKEFIPWVIKQYKSNAEIACLCSGSFFVASTGLLRGKECAVHWGAANDFTKMFPEVKVVNDKVITYGQGIYTSGDFGPPKTSAMKCPTCLGCSGDISLNTGYSSSPFRTFS